MVRIRIRGVCYFKNTEFIDSTVKRGESTRKPNSKYRDYLLEY